MPGRPMRQVWHDTGYVAKTVFFGFLAIITIVKVILSTRDTPAVKHEALPRSAGIETVLHYIGADRLQRVLWLSLITALTLVCTGCASTTAPPSATPSFRAPFGHVFTLVDENANYSDVIGSSAMPYLNSLANQYGLATQYYADTHPSIGNYLMWTTGQILTNDNSQTPQTFPVSVDNAVRELIASGNSWKQYAESIPSVGYIGGDSTCCGGQFYTRHAPLPYMTDAQASSQVNNIVPFTQFANDLANNTLPKFSFITPNGCNDAHDCGLDVADSWLQTNIDPLIKSEQFQKDGLLVIAFDESRNDNRKGGGRTIAVIISTFAKGGYKSTTVYRHESVLRLMLEGLGVKVLPGSAATAPKMWEFFNFTPPT